MKIKKIVSLVITIFASIVLVAQAALVLVPQAMGYGCFAVVSGSMEPTIPVGALVFTQSIEFDDIQNEDVLTFTSKNGKSFFTHRVEKVDVDNKMLYTKGDANEFGDPAPTSFDYVRGEVVKSIGYLGYIKIVFTSIYGVAAISVLLLIYIIASIVISKRKNFKKES